MSYFSSIGISKGKGAEFVGELKIGSEVPDLVIKINNKTVIVEYIAKKAIDERHWLKAYNYKEFSNLVYLAYLKKESWRTNAFFSFEIKKALSERFGIGLLEVDLENNTCECVSEPVHDKGIHDETIGSFEQYKKASYNPTAGQKGNHGIGEKGLAFQELEKALVKRAKKEGYQNRWKLEEFIELFPIFYTEDRIKQLVQADIKNRFKVQKIKGRYFVGLSLDYGK